MQILQQSRVLAVKRITSVAHVTEYMYVKASKLFLTYFVIYLVLLKSDLFKYEKKICKQTYFDVTGEQVSYF